MSTILILLWSLPRHMLHKQPLLLLSGLQMSHLTLEDLRVAGCFVLRREFCYQYSSGNTIS